MLACVYSNIKQICENAEMLYAVQSDLVKKFAYYGIKYGSLETGDQHWC